MKTPCLDCGKAHEQTEECVNRENRFIDCEKINVIQFKDRDIIFWKMPDGEKQPFYRSSGRNSGKPGTWLPFDGFRESYPG